jgi:hypothetical protein
MGNPLNDLVNTAPEPKPGKVTLTEEAMGVHLRLIDALTEDQRKGAVELLQLVHENFPLEELMPEGFKGSHSLTLKDGKLLLTLWCNGKCYRIEFTD